MSLIKLFNLIFWGKSLFYEFSNKEAKIRVFSVSNLFTFLVLLFPCSVFLLLRKGYGIYLPL